ncbi:MAG TPA: hypothetical protein VMU05_12105 [Dongiaceae bacterium]|nr:hypothetical protein [Dongiaceae bacterium]
MGSPANAPLERDRLRQNGSELPPFCGGPYLDLLDKYGLSVNGIVGAVHRVLERKLALRERSSVNYGDTAPKVGS